MNVSALFIGRPVMTTLLMASMVIFGILGYARLPVSELPAVEFPTISISASLAGADPETMASSVATPLENELSSIAGIASMTSQSTLGGTRITLQFDLDRDIDAAAQDVQAAISSSLRDLPDEMTSPPTFRKSNPAERPILYIAMSSPTARLSDVNKYAEGQLARRISTIAGVSEVNVYGSQKYAVRIQLDPNALAARDLVIADVSQAVSQVNVNQSSGTLSGLTRDATIQTSGQLEDAAAFARQIVTYRDGAPVRIGDLGVVVDSIENNKRASWFNGTRAIVLAIKRQPGSNTIAVVDAIRQVLPAFEAQLPPSMHLDILYDRSQSIRASVHEVEFTLVLAACLVVLVIFLFLRTLSATLIPSLALPITVIGTFAGMAVMGFSLDNLSLLALTLSVGFVVDDAIVMLENIVRHIEKGETPHQAALIGSREVGFTIVSMTVSLAAVFIPILFMGGIIGRLLNEFAVTIVLAILVSGVISVTLTPMLCSRMIRAKTAQKIHATRPGGLLGWFETGFMLLQDLYARSLRWSMRHHRLTFASFLASIALSAVLFQQIPKDFLPTEDSGRIIAFTQGTAGGSLEEMAERQKAVAEILSQHPAIDTMMSSVGAGGPRSTASSGTIFIGLKPFSERNKSAFEVVQELRPQLSQITGISVYLNIPPSIRIGGSLTKAEYQYTLQDLDLQSLYAGAINLTEALAADPLFVDVTNNLDLSSPAVKVQIDRDRAAAVGVTPAQIQTALGLAFGGRQVSTMYKEADQYAVMMELLPQYQRDAAALSRLYVRSSQGGQMVPLSAVTTVGRGALPETINHVGQLPAVTVSFNLPAGVSLSEAVERLHQIEADISMSATTQGSFQGTAEAFESAMTGMGWLLLMAVFVVYVMLGILYESFIHPLTILSGLPSAAVGALFTLWVFDMPLNLYGFVGIIMLVGIVKKNAIMMIDFALVEQREKATGASEAIYQAALVRFRPIMMTTMAAVMGILPIAVGYGAGGEARQPLGLAVVGGLFLSQFLTLYITPVLYVYLDQLSGSKGELQGAVASEISQD